MERLLAIWVEALCEEAPDGSTLRDYSALLDALTILCPFTEPVRLGLLALPVRGPSRFFGGEEAVLAAVAQTVRDVTGHEPSLGVADGLFCAEVAARRGLVHRAGRDRAVSPLSVAEGVGSKGRRHDVPATRAAHGGFVRRPRARARGGTLQQARAGAAPRRARRVARTRAASVTSSSSSAFASCAARTGWVRSRWASSVNEARAMIGPRRPRTGCAAASAPTPWWWPSLRGGRVPEDRATLVPWGSPSSGVRDRRPVARTTASPLAGHHPGPPGGGGAARRRRPPDRHGVAGLLSETPARALVLQPDAP